MNASDEIVDFLVHHIPVSALVDFKPSEEVRQRVWMLVDKEKESGLLPQEKVELGDFLKLEHLVLLAKARALVLGADDRQLRAREALQSLQGNVALPPVRAEEYLRETREERLVR